MKDHPSLLIDRYGRKHTYLRISVTDRCNLRCNYCMPADGIAVKPKSQILAYEEIFRLAKIFAELGITKVRLTGGEPLVRRDLELLVGQLASIKGIETLALTTNGVLLKDKARRLQEAGLSVINISLDSLRAERFKQITLRDDFNAVKEGLEESLKCGFKTIKLNVVVIKGKNDDEIIDFVHFAKNTALNVRFIEFMPFKDNEWLSDSVVSFAQMRQQIEREFELVPLETEASAVAKDFALKNHTGTVSFITSMTDSFCGSCNRLRMTADGSLKTCLFYAPEVSLRDAIRSGMSDKDLRNLILNTVMEKPESHPPMEVLANAENRAMVEIGG